MSFIKYLTTNAERQRPRTADGFPIRGDRVPFLKQHEYENIQLGLDAHVKIFELDKPEHLQAYQDVLDKVHNGLFVRLAEDREQWVEARQCWFVLMRWAEVKGEFSPGFIDAVGGYTQ